MRTAQGTKMSNRVMPVRPLFFMLAAAIVCVVASGPAGQAQDRVLLAGAFELDVESGVLTLEARGTPLSQVIRGIGERAGFETVIVGDLESPVSASFAGVPLDRGLDRLLRDVNRVVVYAGRRSQAVSPVISQLWVFGTRGATDAASVDVTESSELAELGPADETGRAGEALRLAKSSATRNAVEALSHTLWVDEDAFVRSRAAFGLGTLQDERAVPALEFALADERAAVRMQAIHALGQIGGERATTALGDVLLYGSDRNQRIQAAWALGRQDTALARALLDAVANDPDKQVSMASRISPGSARDAAAKIPTDAEYRGNERIQ